MATETEEAKRLRVHALWQAKLAADPWNGWRALLNGWKIEDVAVPVDADTPFQGYYRSKKMDGTMEPVAFFRDDDKWVCLRPKRHERYAAVVEGDEEWVRVIDAWKHISRRPISHAWYKAVAEDNLPWPDADARVTTEALAASSKPAETAKIGDNNPPEETPRVALLNKIANAKGGLPDYAKITDEEQQTKARSLKNRLTELKGEAEKERERLSRPNLDALVEIRKEWSPLVDEAAAAAATITKAMDAWETFKLQEQRKEEQRVRDEQAEADRVKRDNELKTQQAEATGTTAELEKVPDVKPAEQKAPPVNTQVGAAYGRKGAVKTKFVVTGITDAQKLFEFLCKPKLHSELAAGMIALAQRAKDAGYEPDGVSIEEVARVKG